jgi:hypothetical protein
MAWNALPDVRVVSERWRAIFVNEWSTTTNPTQFYRGYLRTVKYERSLQRDLNISLAHRLRRQSWNFIVTQEIACQRNTVSRFNLGLERDQHSNLQLLVRYTCAITSARRGFDSRRLHFLHSQSGDEN